VVVRKLCKCIAFLNDCHKALIFFNKNFLNNFLVLVCVNDGAVLINDNDISVAINYLFGSKLLNLYLFGAVSVGYDTEYRVADNLLVSTGDGVVSKSCPYTLPLITV
jgi:hypothetical protein